MKKVISALTVIGTLFATTAPVLATTGESDLAKQYASMGPALIVLGVITGVLLLCGILFTVLELHRRRQDEDYHGSMLLPIIIYVAAAISLVCTIFCLFRYRSVNQQLLYQSITTEPIVETTTEPTTEATTEPTTEATTEPTTEATEPEPTYIPERTEDTDPANWSIDWEIITGGSIVDSYSREEPIHFDHSSLYTSLAGITTFRGDNYRTGATYGTALLNEKTLTKKWSSDIDYFNTWGGCGWTGQPIVVRWDAQTKSIMNLYEEKQAKEDLVEVIYATLDGHIYFYDLDDGSYTRDPINMGMNFKGAGTLDPRGYPIMYVGSGDFVPSMDYSGKAPRMYAVSLIDGSILFERTGADGFSLRGWYAFDGAPLVDAETDTLIWPGENGIIYTIKLNTQFDINAGTLTIDPEETVKVRYSTNTGKTVGFESSPIIVDSYLYAGDNGGMFFCVDLNTMELIWAQDIQDDLNATPVFEWGADGKGYLYLATSLEFSPGVSYLYKLDAATGAVVWEKSYSGIPYNKDVSGGALSSPLLGKVGTTMENMILFHIARTPTYDAGTLVALNTQTGEIIWEKEMTQYSWSTPTAVYTEDGTGYVIMCDANGYMFLLDGTTGETLDTAALGSNIEASPVVFENTVVVGTKGATVYAISLK